MTQNRRDFWRTLLGGAAAAVTAPSLLLREPEPVYRWMDCRTKLKTFARGGIVDTKGLVIFGEGDPPEAIIPLCTTRCRFKFGGGSCGYTITAKSTFHDCGKTLEDCRVRGAEQNFGGFPGVPLGDFSNVERLAPGTGALMVETEGVIVDGF